MEQNEHPTIGNAAQFAPTSLMSNVLASLGLEDDSVPEQTMLSSLIRALDNTNWQVRAQAVRALANFGEQAPIESVAARLNDEHKAVRAAAALALGKSGRHVLGEPLLAALKDPEWQVRAAAVQAVGMLHEQFSREVLIPGLSDEEAIVRASTLRALTRFGGRPYLDLLLPSFHDTSWLVRETAALLLSEPGKSTPIEPLMLTLKDENRCVREAAQMALEQSHSDELPMLLADFIVSSNEQQTNHVFSFSEQSRKYQKKEASIMDQTELNGQLLQQEQHEVISSSQEPAPAKDMRETRLPRREHTHSNPRRSRLFSFLNGIAAVLVVGLIISGSLLLFTTHHPQVNPTSASTPSTTSPLKTGPLPGGCFDYNPGVEQFCAQNPFTLVNESKQIGSYMLTIEGVYADANRGIIAYTLKRNTDHKLVTGSIQGSDLRTQQGTPLPINGGGSGWLDTKHNTGLLASFFDTSSLPEDTRQLSLHLTITFLQVDDSLSGASSNPFIQSQVTFDFTVPFHPGRVINLHKTINAGGASVTLERMVLTPSETRFYAYGSELGYGDAISLSLVGRDVYSIDGAGSPGHCVRVSNQNIHFDYSPFFDYHGAATVSISDPCGKYGPWIFHFNIP